MTKKYSEDKGTAFITDHIMQLFLGLMILIHLVFLVYFIREDLAPMAFLNGACGLVEAVMIALSKQKEDFCALMAAFVMFIYALLSTLMLGYETGFFLYPLTVMVLLLQCLQSNKLLRTIMQVFGFIFVMILVPVSSSTANYFGVAREKMEPVSDALFEMNVILVGVGMLFLSYAFAKKYDRAAYRMQYLSEHDELTGLLNRLYLKRYMEDPERLEEELPFAVVMADIDGFKNINDTYGHDNGDVALKYLADSMRHSVRRQDAVVRWGQERFLIILDKCPMERARDIAEEIRTAAAANPYDGEHNLTITLGVASSKKEEHYEKTIDRADMLLRQGKAEGKNRSIFEE